MITARTKKRTNSEEDRYNLRLVDEYARICGTREVDLHEVVLWAEKNGRWNPPKDDARKKFARQLARAMTRDQFPGDDGEPVRRRHPITIKKGKTQQTFWKLIEDLSPDEMRQSAQGTRKQLRGVILQKERDLRHFNKHYNPGAPVQLSWNFDLDIEENSLPTDYPSSPE